MLAGTMELPAFVEGRLFDVLAANGSRQRCLRAWSPGRNRLRDVFLDPAERNLYPDWDEVAAQIVARLRESVGADVDGPDLVGLVGEPSLASPHFRGLWGRATSHAG